MGTKKSNILQISECTTRKYDNILGATVCESCYCQKKTFIMGEEFVKLEEAQQETI